MAKKPTTISARDRMLGLLLALPFLAGGAFPIGIGLHWIPIDPARVHAPGWVLVICGLIFLSAGLAIVGMAFGARSNPLKFVTFVLVIGLTVITHWVAFGDGERHFMSTRSTNGIRVELSEVDEAKGRRMFAIGAVILDLGLVTMAALRTRKRLLQP